MPYLLLPVAGAILFLKVPCYQEKHKALTRFKNCVILFLLFLAAFLMPPILLFCGLWCTLGEPPCRHIVNLNLLLTLCLLNNSQIPLRWGHIARNVRLVNSCIGSRLVGLGFSTTVDPLVWSWDINVSCGGGRRDGERGKIEIFDWAWTTKEHYHSCIGTYLDSFLFLGFWVKRFELNCSLQESSKMVKAVQIESKLWNKPFNYTLLLVAAAPSLNLLVYSLVFKCSSKSGTSRPKIPGIGAF